MQLTNKHGCNSVTIPISNISYHLGKLCEMMNDTDKALFSYENVLRHNHFNVTALRKIASIYRSKDQYQKVCITMVNLNTYTHIQAVEYYQRALNVDNNNCEIWGALGHCFLMMDDLQKAYTAYHQALYNAKLQNAKVLFFKKINF